VAATDIRYGLVSGPPGKLPDAIHLGDYIEITEASETGPHPVLALFDDAGFKR
jgi:hypothetical protein